MKTKRTCFWGDCHLCAYKRKCKLPENTSHTNGWALSDEELAERFVYSRFRSRLSTKGISLKRLSAETGIDIDRIKDFKNTPPTIEELQEIIPRLGDKPSYFLTRELTNRTRTVRKNIDRILSERAIGVKELAKMTGMDYSDLWSRLNSKDKNIGNMTIKRFAKALGVTPEELEEK